jgi:hypothetical protein
VLEAGIVDAIEKVLHTARHIAKVLRRAEDEALRRQHVFGAGLQRFAHHDFDIAAVRIPRPRQHGLEHAARGAGLAVIDNEQALGRHRPIMARLWEICADATPGIARRMPLATLAATQRPKG